MRENSENQTKKILLIKLSSLGDVIFNIPLANSLKKAGYKITWLVSEKGFDIINENECVDNVILAPFEKWKKQDFKKSLREYISILKQIKSENFDYLIDTQGRWKSLIFTLFSGIKKRFVTSDSKELAFLGATDIIKLPKGWKINVVEKYLHFLIPFGLEGNPEDMTLPYTEESVRQKIDELLSGCTSPKPIAIICPSTTWSTKHWDKENWKTVVDNIKDKFNLIFTGTGKDYDYIENINRSCGLNLAGKTNLKELIELFRRADIVISLDSGSTHLARAARAKAIISIFCATPETYYAPIGENYISLGEKSLSCRPCHKRKCRNKHNFMACTKLPQAEEVLTAIKILTEKGKEHENKTY